MLKSRNEINLGVVQLFDAVSRNDTDTIKYVVEDFKVCPIDFERFKFSVIETAVDSENIEMINWCCNNDMVADINYDSVSDLLHESETSNTGLHTVKMDKMKNSEKMLKMFLNGNNNIQINGLNINGDAALHLVLKNISGYSHNECMSLVEFLLQNGADPNYKNLNYDTPLHCYLYHVELLNMENKFLRDITFGNNKNQDECIHEMISLFLEYDVNINALNAYAATLLHLVTAGGISVLVVRLLMEHGAITDIRDNLGYTPLCYALRSRDCASCSIILEHSHQRVLLDLTIYFQPFPIAAKLLIKYGADVNYESTLSFSTDTCKRSLKSILYKQINVEHQMKYLLSSNLLRNITSIGKVYFINEAIAQMVKHEEIFLNTLRSKKLNKGKYINSLLHLHNVLKNYKRTGKKQWRLLRQYQIFKTFQKSCKNLMKLLINYCRPIRQYALAYLIRGSVKLQSELQDFVSELLISNETIKECNRCSHFYFEIMKSISYRGILFLYHRGMRFCSFTLAKVSEQIYYYKQYHIHFAVLMLMMRELYFDQLYNVDKKIVLGGLIVVEDIDALFSNPTLNVKIGPSTITYFEFSLANKNRLATILSNNDIYKIFLNKQYDYGLYNQHLNEQFLTGRERLNLFNRCLKLFIRNTIFYDDTVVRSILEYLNNDELLTLIDTFTT